MNRLMALPLFAVTVLLTSCATLDKSECESVNWNSLGYRDGAAGFKASRLEIHAKACAKHNIATNDAEYKAGFAGGLYDFCLAPTGYRLGLELEDYHYQCPVETEAAFLQAYADGLQRTLVSMNWRYGWLEHRYDINQHFYRLDSDSEKEDKDRQRQLLDSIDNAIDNLKMERLRVRGMIRRAREHAQGAN